MEELKEIVIDEIKSEIENLKNLQAGSDEKSKAIESINSLYKTVVEDSKSELDYQIRNRQLNLDTDKVDNEWTVSTNDMKERVKDRYWKAALEAAGIGVPALIYVICYCKGLEFEKTGTVTSSFFKSLVGKKVK